jgi:hypothetical protein
MIDEDKYFYFVGGGKATSLEELKEALKHCPNSEFVFHLNSGKNDFANWVEGVFGEHDLADDLRKVMERHDVIYLIDRYLKRKKREEQLESIPTLDESDVQEELKYIADEDDLPNASSPDKIEVVNLEESSHDFKEIKVDKIDERELTESDLKELTKEAKQELDSDLKVKPSHEAIFEKRWKDRESVFIVKEFIYGFLLGLIFGLIMAGVLFNLRT